MPEVPLAPPPVPSTRGRAVGRGAADVRGPNAGGSAAPGAPESRLKRRGRGGTSAESGVGILRRSRVGAYRVDPWSRDPIWRQGPEIVRPDVVLCARVGVLFLCTPFCGGSPRDVSTYGTH